MATAWKRVKWSLASQVFDRMGLDGVAREDVADLLDLAPAAALEALKSRPNLANGVQFLAQALPRYETAAWAGLAARKLSSQPAVRDEETLRAVDAWIAEPAEPLRRACYAAAEPLSMDSPARLAAFAVFFSGGSIAPIGAPDVEPRPEHAGQFASGAVRIAALRAAQSASAFAEAIDLGERIAAGELKDLMAAA